MRSIPLSNGGGEEREPFEDEGRKGVELKEEVFVEKKKRTSMPLSIIGLPKEKMQARDDFLGE